MYVAFFALSKVGFVFLGGTLSVLSHLDAVVVFWSTTLGVLATSLALIPLVHGLLAPHNSVTCLFTGVVGAGTIGAGFCTSHCGEIACAVGAGKPSLVGVGFTLGASGAIEKPLVVSLGRIVTPRFILVGTFGASDRL